ARGRSRHAPRSSSTRAAVPVLSAQLSRRLSRSVGVESGFRRATATVGRCCHVFKTGRPEQPSGWMVRFHRRSVGRKRPNYGTEGQRFEFSRARYFFLGGRARYLWPAVTVTFFLSVKSRTTTVPRLTLVSVPPQVSLTRNSVPRTDAALLRPRTRKRP